MTEEVKPEGAAAVPPDAADKNAPAETPPPTPTAPPPDAVPPAVADAGAPSADAIPPAAVALPSDAAAAPPVDAAPSAAADAAPPQDAAAQPPAAAPSSKAARKNGDYYQNAPEPPPAPVITETTKPTVVVRFGAMGLLGRFTHALEAWRCGQRVVIKSERGMEIGTISCSWGGCGQPQGVGPQIKGEILRPVAHMDEVEDRHLKDSAQREFAYAKQCIGGRGLPMKMVAVEHLFGGDRIIFYFVSESRVDFRALVRDLAHEFQTRIEMRQIGVRDEARLLGDYERCGRPLCCRAWIKELEPVSMKMAKVQKATLDPAKISGRCGRLMCCLRFEHTTYRDLAKNLPRKNTLVMTAEGRAKVLDTDIVSQTVMVLLEKNGNRVTVPVETVRPVEPGTPLSAAPEAAAGEKPVAGTVPAPAVGRSELRVALYRDPESGEAPTCGSESEVVAEGTPEGAVEAAAEGVTEGVAEGAVAAAPPGSAPPSRPPSRDQQGRPPRDQRRPQRGGEPRGGDQRRGQRSGERQGQRPPQSQPPRAPRGERRLLRDEPAAQGKGPPQGESVPPVEGVPQGEGVPPGEGAPQGGAPQASGGQPGGGGGPQGQGGDGRPRRGRRRSRRGGRNRGGRPQGGPGGQPGGQGGGESSGGGSSGGDAGGGSAPSAPSGE